MKILSEKYISKILICLFVVNIVFYTARVSAQGNDEYLKQLNYSVSHEDEQNMFNLVRDALNHRLDETAKGVFDAKKYKLPNKKLTGVYVTLMRENKLLGCRGTTIDDNISLADALVDAAIKAGFKDRRFNSITLDDLNSPDFEIIITTLGKREKIQFANDTQIVNKLIPFKHSVRIYSKKDERISGIFLESVWSKYAVARDFLQRLKKKIGIENVAISPDEFEVELINSETFYDNYAKIRRHNRSISLGLEAFKTLFHDDGKIEYEIDFSSPDNDFVQGNKVREMGSIYSLAYMLYTLKDNSLIPVVERALNNIESSLVKHSDGYYYIADDSKNIKIGATSLALLAILYYEKSVDLSKYDSLREKFIETLKHNFVENGGFRASPDADGIYHQLYDGESWLAMSVYYDTFPNKELFYVLKSVDDTMLSKYKNNSRENLMFFTFGLLVASKRYLATKDERFIDFLKSKYEWGEKKSIVRISFASCSLIEGYSETALAFKESSNMDLYEDIHSSIKKLTFIPYNLQVNTDVLPNKMALNPSKVKYKGLFLVDYSSSKSRNDVNAHCILALIKTAPYI